MAASSRVAAIVQRFSQHAMIQSVRTKAHTLFSRYLLVTNTTVSFCMAGTGDLINQRYESLRGMRTSWSPVRTRNQCALGLFFGPVFHYWYILLDCAMPGRSAVTVVRKVFVDQVLMTPIAVSLFLVILGKLEGQKSKDIVHDVKNKGPDLLAAEWTFGPATQLFNFYILPTRFRVVYDCFVGLCFDAYYSYVKYRKHTTNVIAVVITEPGDESETVTNDNDTQDVSIVTRKLTGLDTYSAVDRPTSESDTSNNKHSGIIGQMNT